MIARLPTQPLFAEISDKMPTVVQHWLLAIIGAALVFGMYRASRLTLLVTIPLSGIWLWCAGREFQGDEYFQSAVETELGLSYLSHVSVTAALPLVVAAVSTFLGLRSLRCTTAC